jgi:hypothetical protein
MGYADGRQFRIAQRAQRPIVAPQAGGARAPGRGGGGGLDDLELFEGMKAAGAQTEDVYQSYGNIKSWVKSMQDTYNVDVTRVTDPTDPYQVKMNQQYQQAVAGLYTKMNRLKRQQEDYADTRGAMLKDPNVMMYQDDGTLGGMGADDTAFDMGRVVNYGDMDITKAANKFATSSQSPSETRARNEIIQQKMNSLIDMYRNATDDGQRGKIFHEIQKLGEATTDYSALNREARARKQNIRQLDYHPWVFDIQKGGAPGEKALRQVPGVKDVEFSRGENKYYINYEGESMEVDLNQTDDTFRNAIMKLYSKRIGVPGLTYLDMKDKDKYELVPVTDARGENLKYSHRTTPEQKKAFNDNVNNLVDMAFYKDKFDMLGKSVEQTQAKGGALDMNKLQSELDAFNALYNVMPGLKLPSGIQLVDEDGRHVMKSKAGVSFIEDVQSEGKNVVITVGEQGSDETYRVIVNENDKMPLKKIFDRNYDTIVEYFGSLPGVVDFDSLGAQQQKSNEAYESEATRAVDEFLNMTSPKTQPGRAETVRTNRLKR